MSETKDQTVREMMDCGHPVSLLIKSVESDYQYCELCNAKDERRDALTMEARYKSQLGEMRAELAASRADAYERAAGICGAHTHANLILSLITPTDAAALAERDRRIRLEEAKRAPHGENCLMFNHDKSPTGLECSCQRGRRLAELRAPVPAEGEK